MVIPSDHTNGATSGAETADLSEEHVFSLGFSWVRVVQYLVFSVVFYRSLFALLNCCSLHDFVIQFTTSD
jgi:hypothetical protein